MNCLQKWLASKHFKMLALPGVQDMAIFSPAKVVILNKHSKPQVQLVTLLHECGHVCIYQCRIRRKKRRIAGCSYREWMAEKGRMKRGTCKEALAVLEEEIEAWERGAKLAKRLGISYPKAVMERERVRALMTYTRISKKKTVPGAKS